MSPARLGLVAAVLAVVVGYAVLASRWTAAGSRWAATLRRPPWQPPDAVFGVVWPLNFGALAVAGITLALREPPRVALAWLGLLTASVALALAWARAFYLAHDLARAAVLLGGASALTWALVAVTGALQGWAGWVLVPYAAWLTVATSLAVGYRRLNGRATVTSS